MHPRMSLRCPGRAPRMLCPLQVGETPSIGAPEGVVIPPTVGSQGPELKRVFGDAPGSLLDVMQPPGCIGSICGVVERPPEFLRESHQVG